MPRYYFHIREGAAIERDHDGSELSSSADALREAVAAAKEMVSEAVLHNELIDGRTFEVTLDDGTVVLTLPFTSVIRL